jgi:hypothetical protein
MHTKLCFNYFIEAQHIHHYIDERIILKQILKKLLERNNQCIFLTLFNNAVITLNQFVKNLLRGDRQTES